MKKSVFTLFLGLFVSSLLAQSNNPNNWTPETYTQSTQLYVSVLVNGARAQEGDIVAGFDKNGECRFKKTVQIYNGIAWVNGLAQGEQVEELSFKLYELATGIVEDAQETIMLKPNETVGSPTEPEVLNFTIEETSVDDAKTKTLYSGEVNGVSNAVVYNNMIHAVVATDITAIAGYPDGGVRWAKHRLVSEEGEVTFFEPEAKAELPQNADLFISPEGKIGYTYRNWAGYSYAFNSYYKLWDGISLNSENPFTQQNWGLYPRVGFDENQSPFLVSFSAMGYYFVYHTKASGSWSSSYINGYQGGWIGNYALANNNGVVYATTDVGRTDGARSLRIFKKDGGTWTTEDITTGISRNCDLKFLDNHLYSLFNQNDEIKLASNKDGAYTFETVAQATGVYHRASLFFREDKTPVVAFQTNDKLTVVEKKNDTWNEVFTKDLVEASTGSRQPTLLMKNEQLHVVYGDSQGAYATNLDYGNEPDEPIDESFDYRLRVEKQVMAFSNSTVRFPVHLDNTNGEKIIGLNFKAKASDPNCFAQMPLFEAAPNSLWLTESYNIQVDELSGGEISVYIYFTGKGEAFQTSGEVGELVFGLGDIAVDTEFEIELRQCDINESNNAVFENGSAVVQESKFPVQGKITSLKGKTVEGVWVTLEGGTESHSTLANPNFSFTNITKGDYTLFAKKEGHVNGISAYDASLLLQYLNGYLEFTLGQMIAADVSSNGKLSAVDISLILQRSAGIIDEYEHKEDWVLVTSPLTDQLYSGEIVVPDFDRTKTFELTEDVTDEAYTIILLGDISGNWSPEVDVNKKSSFVTKNTIEVKKGERITLAIRQNELHNASGFSFATNTDQQMLSLAKISLAPAIEAKAMVELSDTLGSARMAVALSKEMLLQDGVVATLEYDVLKSGFTQVGLTTVVVNEKNVNARLEGKKVELISGQVRVYPTLFTDLVTIEMPNMDSAEKAQIQVFSLSGKLQQVAVSKSRQNLSFEGAHLPKGVYILKVDSKAYRLIKQ